MIKKLNKKPSKAEIKESEEMLKEIIDMITNKIMKVSEENGEVIFKINEEKYKEYLAEKPNTKINFSKALRGTLRQEIAYLH